MPANSPPLMGASRSRAEGEFASAIMSPDGVFSARIVTRARIPPRCECECTHGHRRRRLTPQRRARRMASALSRVR
jgi:hypothetical protein